MTTAVRFVLASASPGRRGLLQRLGIEPDVVVSGVREDDVTGPAATVVRVLAERKASAVASTIEGDAVVLGCDSVLEMDGEVRGKPASPDDAVARWRSMRGRTGALHTGHCLQAVNDGRVVGVAEAVAVTVVRFGRPSDDEIEALVATGEPLAVAGGFTLDGRSAAFVDGIDGCPSNVIGCSLPTLETLLATFDRSVTDWW